ncbi:hypothetical protein [Yersinia aleksiciae]|uniref:hypothetical protein n=1 Tax=Yersinia aleksiciae TaxID=263819 RepID=UPI0036F2E0CB
MDLSSLEGTGTVGVMVANSNLENPVPDNVVVTAVRDHILSLAHSRINEAMSIAMGEYKHVLVSLTDDIDSAATELLVVGELTWT